MQFITLKEERQVKDIAAATNCQVILKHNTSCSISQGVVDRLEAEKSSLSAIESIYLVDVLADKELSRLITAQFGIPHQSPQVLVIRDGRCVYHDWGYTISAEAIQAVVEK